MRTINKLTAVLLAGVMVGGTVFASGCNTATTENSTSNSTDYTYNLSTEAPTFSGSVIAATGKEEVIYVNLDASGAIKDAYVVNIVGGGDVTDYGDYEWVKILNTADKITQNGDKITFSSSADRVYYEGKLKKIELPWSFSVRYFIDGKEYSAEEVAGKSGKLEIKFNVTKNEKSTGNFYESFALQASFTLNTQKCKNISAPDATVANVGKNKQISYTILPGKGIDASVTADVTDFEMSAISINGVPLEMAMEIDDGELTDKIGEVQDAVTEANDGAGELKDGLDELVSNNQTLIDGASDLKEGLATLDGNSLSLTDGAGELKDGLYELVSNNQTLIDGASSLKEGLATLDGNSLSLTNGANDLKDGLTILDGNSSALVGGANDLKDGLAALEGNSATLVGGAWQAYCGLCTAAQEIINANLSASGMTAVTLTPTTYADVLTQLTAMLAEDSVRAQAEQTARAQVTEQVESNALAVYVGYLKDSEDEIYAQYVSSIQDEIYAQYVQQNADDIYFAYVQSVNDANDDILYKQFAYEYVVQQAMANGASQSEAEAYAATAEGQAQIYGVYSALTDGDKASIILAAVDELTYKQMKEILAAALSGLTDGQKEAILAGAVASLTDEQKQSILEGAAATLTDEQKLQIRQGYIEQVMASAEVTAQIEAAVADAAAAREQITQLKAQLDDFGTLYNGIVDYTDGVSQALDGAEELYNGITDYTDGVSQVLTGAGELCEGIADYTDGVSQALDGAGELCEGIADYTDGVSQAFDGAGELCEGIADYTDGVSQALDGAGELCDGITEYTDGVVTAADGAGELKDGLQEFYEQTENMDTEISDKIQEMIDEMTGAGYELNSFVSDKNTEVSSVQFIIQTEAVKIPEPPAPETPEAKPLTFWDKFLKLFGIN